MSDVLALIEEFKKPCPCGRRHETTIADVQIGAGHVHAVGNILAKNVF